MIDRSTFKSFSDEELQAMRDAIDALTREEPRRIFTDSSWCNIVHSVNAEVGHRVNQRQLAARALGSAMRI